MEPGREMDPRRAVAVMDEEGLHLYSVRRLPDAFMRMYLFNSFWYQWKSYYLHVACTLLFPF